MDEHLADTTSRLPEHAQIIDAIEHAVIATDREARITLWSRGARAMFGWSAEEAVGQDGIRLILPEDHQEAAHEILAGLLTGVIWEGDFPVRRIDGRGFWGHVTASPVRFNHGEVAGVVATIQNVTGRRSAEERIQKLEEHRRLASEASRAFTFEHNLITGEIEFSDPVRSITGIDLRNETDRKAFYRYLHPQDVKYVTEAVERAKDPSGPGMYDIQYRYTGPDGRLRWISSRARAQFKGRGKNRKAVRMVGMIMDITESKQAELNVMRSEERLRLAVEGASAFSYERNLQTDEIDVDDNAYSIMRIPTDSHMRNEEFYKHIHPEDAPRLREAVRQALKLDHPSRWDVKYRFTRGDGQVRWFGVRASTQFDDGSGKATRIVGIVSDITDAKEAQDSVARKDERRRLAVEAANAFTYERDLTTGKLVWDHNAYAMTGYPPGRLPDYQDYYARTHPEDAAVAKEYVRQAIEADEPVSWEVEYRFTRTDGEVRWFNSRARTYFDPGSDSKKPVRIVGMVTDVTEKKRAEQARQFLSQASEILASSLDYNETLDRMVNIAVPAQADMCSVYLFQPDGELDLVAMAHRDPAQRDVLSGILRDFPVPHTHVLHRVSLSGDPVLIPQVDERSLPYLLRSHEHIDRVRELRQHSVMAVPLTAHRAILGVLTLGTLEGGRTYDETDLAMAEELGRRCGAAVDNARLYSKLADSERRLALTLQVSGVGFFDRGFPFPGSVFVSERLAQIFGFRLEELPPPSRVEKWFLSRVHPDDLPRLLQVPPSTRPGHPQKYTTELRAQHRKGHWVWVRAINYITERDQSGRITRATGVILDITDMKEAERTLREYSEELEKRVSERTAELERLTRRLRLLATELTSTEQRERRRLGQLIHDDLQQLLVAAKMQVSAVQGSTDDPQGKRTREFAVSLLDQAIAESRSLTAQLRPPALYESGLVSSLDWLAEWMKQAHSLNVEMDLDKSAEPLAEEDAVLLFDSVRELLLNVVKYSGVSAARVTLRKVDGWLHISVSDIGKGFDVAALDSPRADGSGFGLFSIRERLLVMGGKFEARSAPGSGTEVELMVPVSEPTPAAPAAARPDGKDEKSSQHRAPADRPRMSSFSPGKIRVLLVDDHAVVRQGIASVLDGEPDMIVVGEASDGAEAVEAVVHYRPQVVVMDVNLPGLNGVQASRIISGKFPDVRLIGLSIHNDRSVRQAMLDAGACAYLYKDGPVENLIDTIRRQSGLRTSSVSGV